MALIRSNRSRDLRVDFFRGLALWWIYTDHIPGDVLGNYSLRNFAMCDATEVFVLLAGFGAGIAYGSEMNRQGYLYAAADTLRRAWTLYIAHIFLFVVYTAHIFDLEEVWTGSVARGDDLSTAITISKFGATWIYWGREDQPIDTHVLTLRQKLGDPDPITTLRGVGYRLDAE